MREPMPIVLVPGLACSPRLYYEQLPEHWRYGPVFIADHRRDGTLTAIAQRLLDAAPPRFAIIGMSMGGYIAFEVWRQAAERVAMLGLLNTTAGPDTPEQTERRQTQIALAQNGRFDEIPSTLFRLFFPPARHGEISLQQVVQQMADETGPEAFVRQQRAIMSRPDSRPHLGSIRCSTLVVAGENDAVIPAVRSAEIANGIAGAHFVTIPNCGHLSPLDCPREVTRALVEWLD